VGLPDGEEIMTLAFFVLAQNRLMTEWRTDGRTDRHVTIANTCASIVRVKRELIPQVRWLCSCCGWYESNGRLKINLHLTFSGNIAFESAL